MVATHPRSFYHGFATAIFVPVAQASVAELFPTKRGERISLFSSASAVGRGIAPFLGGTILFVTDYGYDLLYLGVGIAGVTLDPVISYGGNELEGSRNITGRTIAALAVAVAAPTPHGAVILDAQVVRVSGFEHHPGQRIDVQDLGRDLLVEGGSRAQLVTVPGPPAPEGGVPPLGTVVIPPGGDSSEAI